MVLESDPPRQRHAGHCLIEGGIILADGRYVADTKISSSCCHGLA